jgi:hypothetical protein
MSCPNHPTELAAAAKGPMDVEFFRKQLSRATEAIAARDEVIDKQNKKLKCYQEKCPGWWYSERIDALVDADDAVSRAMNAYDEW